MQHPTRHIVRQPCCSCGQVTALRPCCAPLSLGQRSHSCKMPEHQHGLSNTPRLKPALSNQHTRALCLTCIAAARSPSLSSSEAASCCCAAAASRASCCTCSPNATRPSRCCSTSSRAPPSRGPGTDSSSLPGPAAAAAAARLCRWLRSATALQCTTGDALRHMNQYSSKL
jgi:hypothetical protein